MYRSILVFVTAIGLTLISASMTISGYTRLYDSDSIIVQALFLLLELSKALIFGIVFVIGLRRHKIPLLILASVLIIISFLGHLSYLSNAYQVNQSEIESLNTWSSTLSLDYSTQREALESQVELLKQQLESNRAELKMLNDNVEAQTGPNGRNWVARQNRGRVEQLTNDNDSLAHRIQSLYSELQALSKQSVETQAQISESKVQVTAKSTFAYTAEFFNISQSKLSSIINLLLAIVIDTLALVMLWVAGDLIKIHSEKLQAWRERLLGSTPQQEEPAPKSEDKPTRTSKRKESTPVETPGFVKVTLDNCRKYSFRRHTVDDALNLSDEDFAELRGKATIQSQVDWLDCVEQLRKARS